MKAPYHLAVEQWVSKAASEPGKLAVAMSALLPATGDAGWPECDMFEDYYQQVCPNGGPTAVEILGQIDHEFDQFAPVLKLPSPSRSLVDTYEGVAACTS